MVESFAQRYWSEFERLAFELAKDCFNIIPTRVLRTQERKDGGFDAVLVHEMGRLKDAVISHETLMEAKLRSGKQSVGLRAFAATMVIAFNGATQCLLVVTNRKYSPQALAAARDFEWKSRLQVILVDQKTLSAWIRPRFQQLRVSFPQELLDDLLLPDPEDEKYEEIEIPGSNIQGLEPPARIGFGVTDENKLAKCEIVFDGDSKKSDLESTTVGEIIVGIRRRQVVTDLATALSGNAGCAVLVGESGTGKSFAIRKALNQLSGTRRCVGIIDLSQINTARQLFLTTIAQLTGVDIAQVAREFTASDAKRIFSTSGGVPVPEDVQAAICSVIDVSVEPKFLPRDVDQLHLAAYLERVANAGESRGGRLLIFHNLDHAPEEVLEFLHSIVPVLDTSDISVLLELTVDGLNVLDRARWNAYVRLFETSATLGRFVLENLTREDAINLILEKLPGLGVERASFIYERIGNRPLFLHHAALWLKTHRVVAERAHATHLIEQPETFFEGLRPEGCVSVLDRHIELWRHEIDLPYADAITAATLLDGHLPASVVPLIIPVGTSVEKMLDALLATGLFISEPGLDGVRVSHSLLFERMEAIETGAVPGCAPRKFERKRIASSLLNGLELFTTSTIAQDLIKSSLYAASEQWTEAWSSAQKAGQALLTENQLARASTAFNRAIDAGDNLIRLGIAQGSTKRIHSLIDLLEVEDQRYRLSLETNSRRLEALSIALKTTRLSTDETTGTSQWLRTRYLSWRAAFTRERFDEALSIANELFEKVCQLTTVDSELAGHSVSALGITLKAIEQTDASVEVFDKGLALFPNSICCRMERWSNLAALALRKDPLQALSYYRRIVEELGETLPVRERLHIEGDLAMGLFLSEEWSEAKAQAVRAITMADANGIPAQAARGRNILACVHWGEGHIDDAIELYDRAILDAERSYMERFLWRFRVNLAAAASEAGELITALANARWAEERILKGRFSHLAKATLNTGYMTSRWYVALLVIALIYHRCSARADADRLKHELTTLQSFDGHLKQLIEGVMPKEVFEGTTHCHAEKIMITG